MIFSILIAFNFLGFSKIPVLDQGGKEPIAYYQREIKTEENREYLKVSYFDLENHLLLIEETEFRDQKPYLYRINHAQLQASATIRIEDKEVFFKKEYQGEKKERKEKITEKVIPPSGLIKMIEQNIESLKAGKKIPTRIAVWDRMETIAFDLELENSKSNEKSETLYVKMVPTNFIIRQLVKPIFFQVNKNSKVSKVNGLLPIKKRKGSSWTDIYGVIFITEQQ